MDALRRRLRRLRSIRTELENMDLENAAEAVDNETTLRRMTPVEVAQPVLKGADAFAKIDAAAREDLPDHYRESPLKARFSPC
jgi:hypothetical protein